MSNLQRYSKTTVLWNGQLLAEESSLTVRRISGAQVVKTVAKGFAGLSAVAPMCEISVENAVPAEDCELDTGESIEGLILGELTIFAAGRTLTSKGFIIDDKFT